MRKRLMLCSAVLLATTPFAFTQQPNATMDAYQNWKRQNAARLSKAEDVPHYVLVGTTQRLNLSAAQVDFVLDGFGRDYTLIIQPLKVQKAANGQTESKKVGEVSTASIGAFGDTGKVNPLFATTVEVIVGPEANALEVKWQIGGKQPVEMVNILMLSEQAETSVSSILSAT